MYDTRCRASPGRPPSPPRGTATLRQHQSWTGTGRSIPPFANIADTAPPSGGSAHAAPDPEIVVGAAPVLASQGSGPKQGAREEAPNYVGGEAPEPRQRALALRPLLLLGYHRGFPPAGAPRGSSSFDAPIAGQSLRRRQLPSVKGQADGEADERLAGSDWAVPREYPATSVPAAAAAADGGRAGDVGLAAHLGGGRRGFSSFRCCCGRGDGGVYSNRLLVFCAILHVFPELGGQRTGPFVQCLLPPILHGPERPLALVLPVPAVAVAGS